MEALSDSTVMSDLLCLDGIAHLHEQLDHANFIEIPDVWDLNVYQCHCCLR